MRAEAEKEGAGVDEGYVGQQSGRVGHNRHISLSLSLSLSLSRWIGIALRNRIMRTRGPRNPFHVSVVLACRT